MTLSMGVRVPNDVVSDMLLLIYSITSLTMDCAQKSIMVETEFSSAISSYILNSWCVCFLMMVPPKFERFLNISVKFNTCRHKRLVRESFYFFVLFREYCRLTNPLFVSN